jgi:hypothetical protein
MDTDRHNFWDTNLWFLGLGFWSAENKVGKWFCADTDLIFIIDSG